MLPVYMMKEVDDSFHTACEAIQDLYAAWVRGDSEDFLDALHPINSYNEDAIAEGDMPFGYQLGNLSMKNVKKKPGVQRLSYVFRNIEGVTERDAELLVQKYKLIFIVDVDPTVKADKQPSENLEEWRSVREEIAEPKRHVIAWDGSAWKVVT